MTTYNATWVLLPLVGALAMAGNAANATTVQGITFSPTASFEFMEIAESEQSGNGNGIIDAVDEKLHGIVRITSITDGNGNQTWANGDGGRELTGYFHDYVAKEFIDVGGKRYIGFTGGVMDIYSDTGLNFERNGSTLDDIAKATDSDSGTPWLTLVGSRILSDASPLTDPNLTLRSEVGQLSFVGTVSGSGLLDIVGGAAAAYLDTNRFVACDITLSTCDDADMTFTSSGQANVTSETRPWASLGTGEIHQSLTIPEPGSLALLGLSISGLAMFRRRRS